MGKRELVQKLEASISEPANCSFLVGFDGFTDEILSCVKKRTSPDTFQPLTHIRNFAERIFEAEGKSTNLELVLKQKKIGGCGPIFALSLIQAGYKPVVIGALGFPGIDPLFQPLAEGCKRVITLAPPGHTDAIEFLDGKIMLGKHETILHLGQKLFERVSEKELTALFDEADIFVSTNWTMIAGMTEVWKKLIKNILPRISPKKRALFVDLADPAKRSDTDLEEALATLREFKKFFTVTLGVNELEARRIAHLFDPRILVQDALPITREKTLELALLLLAKTDLDEVVVHTLKFAAAANTSGTALVDGPYCEKPFISTGGGDNFNGGFLVGRSLHLTLDECLLMGVFTSGFYVRTGKSPTRKELQEFLLSS